MVTNITLLILSLIALYIGANWLVKGSVTLAYRAKITPLVVGLTIVAFGTSAPELVVSIHATLSGQADIAIGNIVGSNIFNICFILGLSALIYPLQAKKKLVRLDIPIMILASALFVWFLWNEALGWLEGLIFFIGIVAYTLFSLYYSRKQERNEPSVELEEQPQHWGISILYILGGLGILVFASQLLIDNAVSIAQNMGVSEAVIGLTIVAAGTSMPELATSIVAALKKNPDIAVGNVVGSNIFNILAIAGTSALIHPMQTSHINYVDLLVMLAVSIFILPLAWTKGKISKYEGAALVLIYLLYTAWLLRDVL